MKRKPRRRAATSYDDFVARLTELPRTEPKTSEVEIRARWQDPAFILAHSAGNDRGESSA